MGEHFIYSLLRIKYWAPFSSPLTAHRATVEVPEILQGGPSENTVSIVISIPLLLYRRAYHAVA